MLVLKWFLKTAPKTLCWGLEYFCAYSSLSQHELVQKSSFYAAYHLQFWNLEPGYSVGTPFQSDQQKSRNSSQVLLTCGTEFPTAFLDQLRHPEMLLGQLFLDYRGRPSGLPRDDSWWEALGTSPLQSVSLLWPSWSSPGADNVLLRRYGEHLSTSLFSLLTQISFCPEISCPLCLFKSPGVCVGPPCLLQFSTDSGSTLDPLMSCCKQGTIALSFHQ